MTYAAAGLLSRPCLSFNGGSIFGGLNAVPSYLDTGSSFSFFGVVSMAAYGAINTIFASTEASAGIATEWYQFRASTAGILQTNHYISDVSTTRSSTFTLPLSPAYIACAMGTPYIRQNGSQQAIGSGTLPNLPIRLTIGVAVRNTAGLAYNNSFSGKMGDLCFYNSALSSTNAAIVETYFKWKYPGL